jgi:hypothetical protein
MNENREQGRSNNHPLNSDNTTPRFYECDRRTYNYIHIRYSSLFPISLMVLMVTGLMIQLKRRKE